MKKNINFFFYISIYIKELKKKLKKNINKYNNKIKYLKKKIIKYQYPHFQIQNL